MSCLAKGCGYLFWIFLSIAIVASIDETFSWVPGWAIAALLFGLWALPLYTYLLVHPVLIRFGIVDKRREREEKRIGSMELIRSMNGHEFERFMAERFRRKGYKTRRTSGSGDQGIDLIVRIKGQNVAVQLKRWKQPVGNSAVQATFAGSRYYDADKAWLVTTSSFTKSATTLARKLDVRLVDGRELTRWMK